ERRLEAGVAAEPQSQRDVSCRFGKKVVEQDSRGFRRSERELDHNVAQRRTLGGEGSDRRCLAYGLRCLLRSGPILPLGVRHRALFPSYLDICGMRATIRSEVVNSSNCNHGRRWAIAL